jgi:hypothetical protein
VYDRAQLPAFDMNGQLDVQSMQDIQQWFVDNQYVRTPADLSKVVDTSYLDYAIGQLGRR